MTNYIAIGRITRRVGVLYGTVAYKSIMAGKEVAFRDFRVFRVSVTKKGRSVTGRPLLCADAVN
jgi:hypothetical protein